MPISKNKKQEIFKDLADIVKKAKSLVFVNFHGVNVTDATALRRSLKDNGVNYVVVKKSLVKKAVTDQKIPGEMPSLDGELGLAYGDDLIAPAREVYDFQKKLDNKIAILGGVFEGVFKSKEEMLSIATIPSLHVLRGQFVNLINSPLQGMVIALNAIAEKKQ